MSVLQSNLRRVITGLAPDGRSFACFDGPPAATLEWPGGDGLYEIWTDPGGSVDRQDRQDRGVGPVKLSPQPGAVKVRWFTIRPARDASEVAQDVEAVVAGVFAEMGASGERPDTSRHPAMHLTATIDVIILLRGRVRLLLDADERVLNPGDVVVQRGTNHAWICEGDEPALLVAVLIARAFA